MAHPTPVAAIRQLADALMHEEDDTAVLMHAETRLSIIGMLLEFAALREAQATATWQPIETAPHEFTIMLWWPHWANRPVIARWKNGELEL